MPHHVAILKKPYLDLILSGRKTIECRLTKTPLPPFRAIQPGDLIFFKRSAGPYMARAAAAHIQFFDQLTPPQVARLRRQFDPHVCADPDFWSARRHCRYATFINLLDIRPISRGPQIAPSRGLAWFVLPTNPAHPKPSRGTLKSPPSTLHPVAPPHDTSFDITLTPGAIRNSYIRLPKPLASRLTSPLHLILPPAQPVATDLLPSGLLRWRGWKHFFDLHRIRAGDTVRFARSSNGRYCVQFLRTSAAP